MEDDDRSVRQTLDRLIAGRGDHYGALSRLIGRNPAYIQQFIKRGTPRKLDEEDRRTLARYFGVDESLLGGPEAAPESSRSGQSNRLGESNTRPGAAQKRFKSLMAVSGTFPVPRLALGASAGAGALVEEDRAVGAIAFDRAWLRDLGVQGDSLSLIRVDGESMAPTLSDGDDIMVDRSDGADRLRDGIYVLRLDGVLMVKRIAIGPRRGRFSILSDNAHYPDWPDVAPDLVAIVGRVVWAGRRLS